MAAPEVPPWPLTPALRLAVLAVLFGAAATLVQGWLSTAMWLVAVLLVVVAAIQLAKNWGRRK